jgi:hypothetical protein
LLARAEFLIDYLLLIDSGFASFVSLHVLEFFEKAFFF